MKIQKYFFALILLFCSIYAQTQPTIEKGLLDLTNVSLEDGSQSIKLSGEVEFYWQKLYSPQDFFEGKQIEEPEYFPIPKSWAAYTINTEKLPSNGFATYRFWVEIKGKDQEQILGIKLPSVFTSYRLWVNSKKIAEAGNVGKSASEHKPGFHIGDIPFSVPATSELSQRIEVIIQISNYSHRRAGLVWPTYIGNLNTLKKESRNLDILNLIVIGIILIIGLNHINMFVFRRKDVANLYFGILSLVMILRNISTGDRIIAYIFPNINWEFLLSIDNFSGYCTIPFFALFIYDLYKNEFPAWLKNAMVILGAILVFSFLQHQLQFSENSI